jgi:hypothetical protein
MKGFASCIIPKQKVDTVLVWTYRKGIEPFECSTVDVGVEKKFYQGDELNVDLEITELEGPFAKRLNEIRSSPDGYRVTDSTFVEFIVHLTARTKHVRDTFINGGGFLADGLLTYLSGNWREYFRKYFAKNREEVKDKLEKSLQEKNASKFHKAKARQLVNSLTPRAMVQIIEQTGNYDVWFPVVRQYMAAELNDIVKQAHIKSLLAGLVSEPRVEHFQKFYWFVRRSSDTLILGDVCCLFTIDSKFKSLGGRQDNIQTIYLPIASDCAVVGNVIDELPSIDPAKLNEASASVSRDYFVSRERSPEMIRLQALLGAQSEFFTNAELTQILHDAIAEHL